MDTINSSEAALPRLPEYAQGGRLENLPAPARQDPTRRVGILTRHCYPNYGSFLQAKALSHAIGRAGAQATVLDYVPHGDTPWTMAPAGLRESRLNSSLRGKVSYLAAQTPNLVVMSTSFRRHQRLELPLSKEVRDADGLEAESLNLDAVVAGSDQIWNRIHGRFDWSYFLTWLPSTVEKLSYAASFGGLPESDHSDEIRAALTSFDTISLREESALGPIRSSGLEARVDVDPVFLPSREYWDDFAEGGRAPAKKYILVYQLHDTASFRQRVDQVRARHGLPIRVVTADARQFLRLRASDYLAAPADFVSLFRNSEVVVTDSFHGTAFALIFGRPIYVIPPARNAARLTDILEHAQASSSVVLPDCTELPDPTYDIERASALIQSRAESSRGYVKLIARGSQRVAEDVRQEVR